MTAVPFIEVDNLTKRYGEDVLALQHVSFGIERGEWVAAMGPSGSGKSTLLNILGLLDTPSKGTVQLNGAPITSFRDKHLARLRNEQIGFIFQTFHLIHDLSVLDNVELPLIYRRLSGAERRRLALLALERVGLASRVHHFPSQLSGGQQQRVAIARAIVADPKIIVADEPTGDLDRKSAEEVLALLKTLNETLGKTIVMVTHDPHAAEAAKVHRRLDKGQLT